MLVNSTVNRLTPTLSELVFFCLNAIKKRLTAVRRLITIQLVFAQLALFPQLLQDDKPGITF